MPHTLHQKPIEHGHKCQRQENKYDGRKPIEKGAKDSVESQLAVIQPVSHLSRHGISVGHHVPFERSRQSTQKTDEINETGDLPGSSQRAPHLALYRMADGNPPLGREGYSQPHGCIA